ncbi:MAG TPA: serine/threonine-protein kinase, partial [Ardenticatenaceae bacterium]|nr:serine/threonine-protein kinase [Ardenticatenaceae bacterium]
MSATLIANRYQLGPITGAGGMATVYQAWDLRMDRPVAVKVLRREMPLSEAEQEAFVREARTVARLKHPNIVEVYDCGVADGAAFVVMELLGGGSLRERLSDGPLGVRQAQQIAEALASALDAAHAERILHLDVKPENVLFTSDDQAKLADFGISRSLEEGLPEASAALVGTPAYLAPEVIQGAAPDVRADVYGLGVVLYEMLTGECPFKGSTPEQQVAQKLTAEPVPVHYINPAVPVRLGRIVLQALARDTDKRFASPAGLAAALFRYSQRADQPTIAYKPMNLPRTPIVAAGARPKQRPGRQPLRWNSPVGLRIALVLLSLIVAGLGTTLGLSVGGIRTTLGLGFQPPLESPESVPVAEATDLDAGVSSDGSLAAADLAALPTTAPSPTLAPSRTPTPAPSPTPTASPAGTMSPTPSPTPPSQKPTPAPLGARDWVYPMSLPVYSQAEANLTQLPRNV